MIDQSKRDFRRILAAVERLDDETPSPTVFGPTLLVKTTSVITYPTVARAYYAVHPQELLGLEAEGSGGTILAASSLFYALNIGSTVPAIGTTVLAHFAGSRWVFQWDS